jgi:hypothetical protein
MTNKNIANLGSITVPLAGTEVIPIWNGTGTEKVTVANLTAGRTVAMAAMNVSSAVAGVVGQLYNTDTSNGNGVYLKAGGVNAGKYNLYLQNAAGQDLLVIYADGVINTGIGNIVQGTAAKGINFTANTPAAGMTSQLLNWYEEGTWTPSFADSGGATPAQTSTGRYTRIGNTVQFWFECILGGSATDLYFTTAFPFTPGVSTQAGSSMIAGTSSIFPVLGINDGRLRAYINVAVTTFYGSGSIRI